MKFLLIAFALIGLAAAAQLPDSATQGPNPQDIATPEPEYIDIDLPEPAAAPAAPAARSFAPAPAPIARPAIAAPRVTHATHATHAAPAAPSQAYLAPQRTHHAPAVHHQLPGHSFSSNSGYQYRRPVYIRRVYRRRRY